MNTELQQQFAKKMALKSNAELELVLQISKMYEKEAVAAAQSELEYRNQQAVEHPSKEDVQKVVTEYTNDPGIFQKGVS